MKERLRHIVFSPIMARPNGLMGLLLGGMLILIASCSGTRHLPESSKLYTGAKIELEGELKGGAKKEVISDLNGLLRPVPNAHLFGLRPRVYVHQKIGEPEKGIKKWVKKRIAKAPVLFEPAHHQRNVLILENRLQNKGFFDARVQWEVASDKNKKVHVLYKAFVNEPYVIQELHRFDDKERIGRLANRVLDKHTGIVGKPYSLDALKTIREEIDLALKEQGYYYFNPDFIIFKVDSTLGERKLEVFPEFKSGIPSDALQAYKISSVSVMVNEQILSKEGAAEQIITDLENSVRIVQFDDYYAPGRLGDFIRFLPGDTYSRSKHLLTLNQLVSLNNFRFVNARFERDDAEVGANLKAILTLVPAERKTVNMELRGVTKSNSFAGPGLNLSFQNRNLFRGAERLTMSIQGSVETQIQGPQPRLSSQELRVEAELVFPRFITPFSLKNVSSRFIPSSRMLFSTDYLNRTQAFSMISIRNQWGYQWNESIEKQHRFNPFVVNFFVTGKLSETFKMTSYEGLLLSAGFMDRFLLGADYSYVYNSQLKTSKPIDWYFSGSVDLSGNVANALFNIMGKKENPESGQHEIWGVPYSQFARFDLDLRQYVQAGSRGKFVFRFSPGLGLAYGNSSQMPYMKRFYTGGPNSIRAFAPRTLGPGTYSAPDSLGVLATVAHSGDIKLEANIEYRYDLSRFIKLAWFLDAGNVWLRNESPDYPGGQFQLSTFWHQIGCGTGPGLRIDAGFFVLRFDAAFPIIKPDKQKFSLLKPELGKSSWRRENLMLNVAFGYPF